MSEHFPETFEEIKALYQKHRLLVTAKLNEDKIQRKIAELLGIDYVTPSPIVTAIIHERRRIRWKLALTRDLGNGVTLAAKLIEAIQLAESHQKNVWPGIHGAIALYNARYSEVRDRVPGARQGIAMSLWGKTDMSLDEFISALDLEMPESTEVAPHPLSVG